MNNFNSELQRDIVHGIVDDFIKIVVFSYKKLISKKESQILMEDKRRSLLLDEIRKNKRNFNFDYTLAQLEPANAETGTVLGRTDITIFIDRFTDQGITVECKRFLKKDICKFHIMQEYDGNGLKRFKSHRYPVTYGYCGMMSFVEEGDYHKLFHLLNSIYNLEDISSQYKLNYVSNSIEIDDFGKGLNIFHIILNFDSNNINL